VTINKSNKKFLNNDESVTTRQYANSLGSRLRAVRKQKHLSLQAVEAISDQEFKASVLGAYERGERAISVPRLQRLAIIYSVPVDQLLPKDENVSTYARNRNINSESSDQSGELNKITIDLVKLNSVSGPERDLLRHYLGMIQLQRQDFNGKVITMRTDDLKIIASLFGMTAQSMTKRLDELQLIIR
jgi:transcriptional regulator with XRE-family HTH domain